jgi:ketosteroid isomerase-like protein
MASDSTDMEAIKQANELFYKAFGALDINLMDAACEISDRSLCVHPGWKPLIGWDQIRVSWQGIFENASLMHFNIQYLNFSVIGDCGWVTCVENITSVLQGRANNFGVAATNIFACSGGVWKLVAHHASPNI